MYAHIAKDSGTVDALPDLIGSGCVVAPDWPKRVSTCWGSPNTYPNYQSTTPICTQNGKTNAANMIRIGIKKGYCRLPGCYISPSPSPSPSPNPTPTPTPTPNEPCPDQNEKLDSQDKPNENKPKI